MAGLTARGREAQDEYRRLLAAIEKQWDKRFGEKAIGALRQSLEKLVGEGGAQAPLLGASKPYPDGWRATKPHPETLPYYPMVPHRGGFSDGS